MYAKCLAGYISLRQYDTMISALESLTESLLVKQLKR